MSRKYICDNCGKEFDAIQHYHNETHTEGWFVSNLFRLAFIPIKPDEDGFPDVIGEYCADCRDRIVKQIKDGVN